MELSQPSVTNQNAIENTMTELPRLVVRHPPLHHKPFKKRFKKCRIEENQNLHKFVRRHVRDELDTNTLHWQVVQMGSRLLGSTA